MLAAIALIPSAPIVVPELAGAAADEVADLRAAVLTAAAVLPPRWITIGVGPTDAVIPPSAAGTFAGYGAEIPVRLSAQADGPVTALPLPALIAGWVRARVNTDAVAEVRVYADIGAGAADHEAGDALVSAGGHADLVGQGSDFIEQVIEFARFGIVTQRGDEFDRLTDVDQIGLELLRQGGVEHGIILTLDTIMARSGGEVPLRATLRPARGMII